MLTSYIRKAQYADDIAVFSDSSDDLQLHLMTYNCFSKKMGLCINIEKTETICVGTLEDFLIDGVKLVNVDKFK